MNQEAKKSNVIPAPGPEEKEPANKNHVYDYVDTNIWFDSLAIYINVISSIIVCHM